MFKTSQTRRAAMVTSSALSPNSSAEPRQPWTAAAHGEQSAREREAVLHDRRRVLVALEHRGAVVAFLQLDVAELDVAAASRLFLIGPFAATVEEECRSG